jgi:hypothetical protein
MMALIARSTSQPMIKGVLADYLGTPSDQRSEVGRRVQAAADSRNQDIAREAEKMNAQATPAPTPELDPRVNNLEQFADMLKQAFDTTQNKQGVEQFMGHFAQDLLKMKKNTGRRQ